MSEYSERSQELARELREKAIRNLARSAKSGKFVSDSRAEKHPKSTNAERAAESGRFSKG